jgi:hypothetical protein
LHDRLIGPFFLCRRDCDIQQGPGYAGKLCLSTVTITAACRVLPARRRTTRLELDSLIVRASLNQHFPNRWIGRAGPISWPARSPHITPYDFFLWGYVKDCVYRTPVADINCFEDRIKADIATVYVDMLQRT